ncbi:MAG: TylF/MycF/NovP-related O-methyltransferase [Pseudomonadota bacterium]
MIVDRWDIAGLRDIIAQASAGSGCPDSIHDKIAYVLKTQEYAAQIAAHPLFVLAYSASEDLTILEGVRLVNIFLQIVFGVQDIPCGNMVEFGSYKGGGAVFMAILCRELYPDAYVVALDTFSGMPGTDPKQDYHKAGDFADSDLQKLQQRITDLNLQNLHVGEGLFHETFPKFFNGSTDKIALAHIDCDIYDSVYTACELAYPHMVEGGLYIFDDALYPTCIGAQRAVEEYMIIAKNLRSIALHPVSTFKHSNLRSAE